MCTAMPGDPWREAADEASTLHELLSPSTKDSQVLERLAHQAPSPLVRRLAQLALEIHESADQEEGGPLSGLTAPDLAARLSCAKALLQTGQQRHLPFLKRRFIDEESPSVRVQLLEAIGAHGGSGQWPFLAGALRDPDRSVRLRVLDLAARLASKPDLVAIILQALRDPDVELRDKALSLLMVAGVKHDAAGAIPPQSPDPVLDTAEKVALARQLLQERDVEMLPVLRRLVEPGEDAAVVAEALRALALLGGPEEAARIRSCVERPEPAVVARALLALAHLRDSSHAARARELAGPDTADVLRAAALTYLAAQGSPAEHAPAQLADYVRHAAGLLAEDRGAELELYEPQPAPDGNT
ncbi:MAG: HEAT repeat domain-containing protein, partial [Candidatus Wallbacteria bacterium]|nr:HEAT repeat domain-containing protein [Candidatus Wallbacteria bacterium]